jgi:hypothetical protein
MSDDYLSRDVATVVRAVLALDEEVAQVARLEDLDVATAAWDELVEACRDLGRIRDALANKIGEAMPERRMLLAGRMRKKHYKTYRRDWQHDDLLRLVVDSRVVDEQTGEIASVLDILKRVYGLHGYNARVTALRELGIDADEFCTSETRGYTIESK